MAHWYPTECKTLGDLRRLVNECPLPDTADCFAWNDDDGLVTPYFVVTMDDDAGECNPWIELREGPFAYGQTMAQWRSGELTPEQKKHKGA